MSTYSLVVDAGSIISFMTRVATDVNNYKNIPAQPVETYFPTVDGLGCYFDMRNELMEMRNERRTYLYKQTFGYAWRNIDYQLHCLHGGYDRKVTLTENATGEQIEQLTQMFTAIWEIIKHCTEESVKKESTHHDLVIYAGYMYVEEFKKIMGMNK